MPRWAVALMVILVIVLLLLVAAYLAWDNEGPELVQRGTPRGGGV